jgi:hypothetical protein
MAILYLYRLDFKLGKIKMSKLDSKKGRDSTQNQLKGK